jgi:lysozyme
MSNIRTIPQEAVDLIKRFEGLKLKAYICAAGFITVGWGHVLSGVHAAKLKVSNPERYKQLMSTKVTIEEAEVLLRQDLRLSALAVLKLTNVELTNGQYAALISFVFNLGAGKYQRSTLRMKLNRKEYEDAAEEFPKWVYGDGKVQPGLKTRRASEQMLFLS